ncbi:MAG TPA: methyltransferase [Nocardioides sp.]|nr:methyltransferase [Nocardioides sp.]
MTANPTATRTTPFGHLAITWDDRVLEPRSWTEAQSTWAAELLTGAPEGPVLELCAGAGQIGLLTIALAPRRLVCVDLDPAAVELTLANAEAAGLGHLVEVREGRIDEVLREGELFPVIVADPPWVPRADTGRFPQDPLLAIDGGDDGLDVARTCVAAIAAHLAPGGSAVLQLGTREQAELLVPELDGLRLGQVRRHDRGVLVRLDREDPA